MKLFLRTFNPTSAECLLVQSKNEVQFNIEVKYLLNGIEKVAIAHDCHSISLASFLLAVKCSSFTELAAKVKKEEIEMTASFQEDPMFEVPELIAVYIPSCTFLPSGGWYNFEYEDFESKS